MIAASSTSNQIAAAPRLRWQEALANAVTTADELIALLGLDPALLPAARAAADAFPLRVPRGFVARMRYGEVHDPLLRQVLPLDAELDTHSDYTRDPVGDLASRAGVGLLHKYAHRVLLITTGACAVHCRYCFRRYFPYSAETATTGRWNAALAALRADASVSEVILSGGDPLSLSDRRLSELTSGLQEIPHLRRLRIHTRNAVVLPERVDAGLIAWLESVSLQKVVVVHVNHAHEIDAQVRAAFARLQAAGATLLNQSVLLAGVNDSERVLVDLSEALFAAGVLPYYLHMLDRVQGAAHFDVSEQRASQLMAALRAELPGYLVPRLVREIPGMPSKTPVALSM